MYKVIIGLYLVIVLTLTGIILKTNAENEEFYAKVETLVSDGYSVILEGKTYSNLPSNYREFEISVFDDETTVVLTPRPKKSTMPIIIPSIIH